MEIRFYKMWSYSEKKCPFLVLRPIASVFWIITFVTLVIFLVKLQNVKNTTLKDMASNSISDRRIIGLLVGWVHKYTEF